MIKRIWGSCDGAEILLRRSQEGSWETTVPSRPTGEYTVALWAEDDAGNRSYFCSILMTYDITQLCCRIQLLDIGADWSADDVAAMLSRREISAVLLPDPVRITVGFHEIAVELIRCQLCGR